MSNKIRYPSIVGKTPAQQIEEIRRYLFTLADDLNYLFSLQSGGNTPSGSELASTDLDFKTKHTLLLMKSSLDGMKSDMGKVKTALDTTSDRVIESGATGVFTYKKWASGRYELLCELTVKCTEDAIPLGSAFVTQEFEIEIPFAVESAIISGSASDNFFVVNGDKVSLDNGIIFHLLSPTAFAVGDSAAVRLYITGILLGEDETSG